MRIEVKQNTVALTLAGLSGLFFKIDKSLNFTQPYASSFRSALRGYDSIDISTTCWITTGVFIVR